jgi:hypothetical protein
LATQKKTKENRNKRKKLEKERKEKVPKNKLSRPISGHLRDPNSGFL